MQQIITIVYHRAQCCRIACRVYKEHPGVSCAQIETFGQYGSVTSGLACRRGARSMQIEETLDLCTMRVHVLVVAYDIYGLRHAVIGPSRFVSPKLSNGSKHSMQEANTESHTP